MKEKIKTIGKHIIEFVKENKSACICFLLAISVAITGTASFAKYVSGDPTRDNPGAAGFHNSAEIDGVSALSFTNMAFWGGLKDIGVSMNSLRTVNINVNNFEVIDGNRHTTEVTSEYSLVFELPQNFADELAIQLIDETDRAMTPQMVLSEFMKIVGPSNPTKVENTKNPLYNGKDYSGIDNNGNICSYIPFEVSYNSDGSYSMVSQHRDGTVITVEPFIKEDMAQTLYFRLWDVESKNQENVELEGGELLPPLLVTFTDDVPCYRITISRPEFTLSAGVSETDKYKLTLAPIEALRDTHLGGYLMNPDPDGNMVYAKSVQSGQPIYLSTVTEVVTSTDETPDKVTLMGSIPVHIKGKVETIDVADFYVEEMYGDMFEETMEPTYEYTTDMSRSKYYTYRSNRWRSANSSTGTYRIDIKLTKTTTLKVNYEIQVRKMTDITEKVTTTSVSDDKTHVEQDVERTTSVTNIVLDVFAQVTETVTYSEEYVYYQRSNTWSDWQQVDNFDRTFTSTYPQSYEMQNPPPVDKEAIVLTTEQVAEFAKREDVKAFLDEPDKVVEFKREKNYTENSQMIIPTSLAVPSLGGADVNISLDPLQTHIPNPNGSGMIQKYYISTSYSKNYPFYVKVHFEQTAQ